MGKGHSKGRARSVWFATLAIVLCAVTLPAVAAWGAVGYDEDPDAAGGVNGPVWGTTLIGNELWVGGEFSTAANYQGQNVTHQRVAAFDVNTGGLLDVNLTANNTVRAIENDGSSIWIGGEFSVIGGVQREGLVKWDALTRTHMNAFDASIDGNVLALKLHRDWLYVGGDFTVGGRRNLIRVDPTTGEIDNGFAPNPNSRVADIDAFGNTIYIAGSFTRVGPTDAREDETYAAGVDWETGAEEGIEMGRNLTDVAQAIGVSPEGDRIYTGDDANVVTAFSSGGSVQWTNSGQGNIQSIVAEGDRVYVGLHDGWARDGDDRMLVALRRNNGATDSAFDIEMSGFWGVRELELTPQGLIAVGEFHSVRGIGARRVANFRPLGAYQPAEALAPLGDADGSGVIDTADVQLILDYAVGELTPDLLERSADMDSDGEVGLFDALLVARTLAANE